MSPFNPTTQPVAEGRDATIDLARGLAVLLALTSHCFIQFGVWDAISPDFRILVRVATPLFLVLFGVSLEIVYVRRWHSRGPDQVIIALLTRAMMCYSVFLLIQVAAALTGKISFRGAVAAGLYISSGRFGVILKIYAVLFTLMPVVLYMYSKKGIGVLLGIVTLAWTVKYVLDGVTLTSLHFISLVFGAGNNFGPAVLPALTLVTFGMIVGRVRLGTLRPAWATLSFVGAATILAIAIGTLGLPLLMQSVSDATLRSANHPYYFAFGALTSLVIITGVDVVRSSRVATWFTVPIIATLGQHSLFAYGLGNLLLNLLPEYSGNHWLGIIFALAFLALLARLTTDVAQPDSRMDRWTGNRVSGFMDFWSNRFERVATALVSYFGRPIRGRA